MRLFILYNLQLEIINFLYKNLRKASVGGNFMRSLSTILVFFFLSSLTSVVGQTKTRGLITQEEIDDIVKISRGLFNL